MDLLNQYIYSSWLQPNTFKSLNQQFISAAKYKRICISNFLDSDYAMKCAKDIEDLSTWKRHETDWFSQDDMHLDDNKIEILPQSLDNLAYVLLSEHFQKYIQAITGFHSLCQPSLVAHRMVAGDYVDVHNDFIPGGDIIRCILYFDPYVLLRKEPSGLFLALGSENVSDVIDIFQPIHNSLVIFEISPFSLHAVTKIEKGHRFSVILSYKGLS